MTQLSIDQLVTRVLDLADRTAPVARASQEIGQSFDEHLSSARPPKEKEFSVDRPQRDDTQPQTTESNADRQHEESSDAAYGKVTNDKAHDNQPDARETNTDDVVVGDASAKLPQDDPQVTTAVDDAEGVEVVNKVEVAEAAVKNSERGKAEQPTGDAAMHAPEKQQGTQEAVPVQQGSEDGEIRVAVEKPATETTQQSTPEVTPKESQEIGPPLAAESEKILQGTGIGTDDDKKHGEQKSKSETVATVDTDRSNPKTAESAIVVPSKDVNIKANAGEVTPDDPGQVKSTAEPKKRIDRHSPSKQPTHTQAATTAGTAQQKLATEPVTTVSETPALDAAAAATNANGAELRTDAPQAPPATIPAATPTTGQFAAANQFTQPLRAILTGAEKSRQPITEAQQTRFLQRVAGAFQNANRGDGEVRIRLHPPELGALRMQIKVEDGVLIARLETETHNARQMLLDNLPGLRERLATQEIRIERFDVDVRDELTNNGQQQAAREQAENSQQRHAQDRTPQHERKNETETEADEKILAQLSVSDSGLNVVI